MPSVVLFRPRLYILLLMLPVASATYRMRGKVDNSGSSKSKTRYNKRPVKQSYTSREQKEERPNHSHEPSNDVYSLNSKKRDELHKKQQRMRACRQQYCVVGRLNESDLSTTIHYAEVYRYSSVSNAYNCPAIVPSKKNTLLSVRVYTQDTDRGISGNEPTIGFRK